MAQYNKQNLLLNQRKTKLNTKEIGDLYEIKIMEKFHPDRLCIFWWSVLAPVLFKTKWKQSKPRGGELLFFSFFFDFFVKNVY